MTDGREVLADLGRAQLAVIDACIQRSKDDVELASLHTTRAAVCADLDRLAGAP
jgi:hypothetical protein